MRAFLLVPLLFAFATAWADVEALRTQAAEAAADGKPEEAMYIYRELIAEAPEDAPAHYALGVLMMDSGGDLAKAITHFKRAGELGFTANAVGFRLARIYARQGRNKDALSQLETLATAGFGRISLFDGEADFDKLRDNPRFVAALKTMRATRYPCEAGEAHHAFDFWIGKWDVSQGGAPAGTNHIQPILNHCAIYEQWESIGGAKGRSFNFYDPSRDHWRQIWIFDAGSFIEFVGEARDGGIFYTAETINPADGSVTHHKFEFTQNDDGSVRQFWAVSSDDKQTWTTSWDATYVRQAEASQ